MSEFIKQKICRLADLKVEHDLCIDDPLAIKIEEVARVFYEKNSHILYTKLIFAVDKFGEWFWKFRDLGWDSVWFPICGLPVEVERELRKFFEHRMNWISILDRVPEEDTRVLISCSEGICSGKLRYGQWQSDPIGSYAGDGCAFDVTHWMPLPETPKDID